jgi:ribosomal protein S18 acetylase RimI-like enzyme
MKQYLDKAMNVAQLERELKNKVSQFYFALQNQEVIGYLKVNMGDAQTELIDKNAFEIERIYVVKNYLGKHVGKLLFDFAIDLAKKLNKNKVWLGVWEKNERAINFYQKNGFITFDSHKFKLGSDIQTDLLMALEL